MTSEPEHGDVSGHTPAGQVGNAALLPYLLTCTPDPLEVSTQAVRSAGKLTLMIGAAFPPLRNSRLEDSSFSYGPDGTGGGVLAPGSSTEVWCQKIVIDIPCGEGPADLARIPDSQTLSTVTALLPNWNASKALIGTNIARFTFTPSRGGSVLFNGSSYVTAVIDKIPVNAEPGTAPVTITETTSSASATTGFADRDAYRDAPKVTAEFYFYDLHPREAAIARGDSPVLEWKGNTSNTDFTVYWSDGVALRSEVLQPSAEAWYPRQHIPLNSTTFLVMAEHRPPGQTTPIRRHLTTTVEVIDPDIIAHEITTKDNITAGGDVTVQGNLQANGDITIAGGKKLKTDKIERTSSTVDLNILGNALVTGELTANGWIWSKDDVWADNAVKANEIGRRNGSGQIQVPVGINAGSGGVTTTGNLAVNGITASGDTRVYGTLRADGTLTAYGPVSLFNNAVTLAEFNGASTQERSYQAPTDGIVIGNSYIFVNQDFIGCTGVYNGQCWSVARNTMSPQSWGRFSREIPVAIAVRRGATFKIYHAREYGDFNTQHNTFRSTFYWIPMGTSATPTTVSLAEGEPSAAAAGPPPYDVAPPEIPPHPVPAESDEEDSRR